MSQYITRMKAARPEPISEVPSRGASLETVAIPRTESQCVLEPIAQGPARRDDRADLTRAISRG